MRLVMMYVSRYRGSAVTQTLPVMYESSEALLRDLERAARTADADTFAFVGYLFETEPFFAPFTFTNIMNAPVQDFIPPRVLTVDEWYTEHMLRLI